MYKIHPFSISFILSVICSIILLSCSTQDREKQAALDFLYAYMPTPDSVDYSEEFYRENIDCSFRAREEMPWGDSVPEREFRHFVLPVRVNNENLDSSRMVFYDELKDRVMGLTMKEAILEVNHWCHEKVTYTPSDERTSSPLASVRTAYGRCGEESTFTVAALRSVCIPARQVYTPRWAHTDDNHAWVEAWADGEWHFLGACEPEAVLDLGWFNAPASRGLLMHTKVFGDYDGPEEVMSKTACYTEINVTKNYAPVGKAWVKVTDEEGKAVAGAGVQFKIYNYAEFYTVADKLTDADGVVSLEAGMGDLLAWGEKDGKYGFVRCSAVRKDTTTLILDKKAGMRYSTDINMVPPKERNTIPQLTDEQRNTNVMRLAQEDSIRNAYIATFDTSTPVLTASRGNHKTIKEFLMKASDKDRANDLLSVVSDKDLRDITLENLMDAFIETLDNVGWNEDIYNRYIMCPRVANEMLVPYRKYFKENVDEGLKKEFQNVERIVSWVKDNITIDEEHNPQHLRMSPIGVWRHRTTDAVSRDIFFVALARTMGQPARVNSVTGEVQVYQSDTDNWTTVLFTETSARTEKGTIVAEYEPTQLLPDPKYYTHFSLSALKDCKCQLMNYGEGDTYESLLKAGSEVDAGDYLLITGTRMADGSVLAHLEIFPVMADTVTTVPLKMRRSEDKVQVIGSFNSENKYKPVNGSLTSILSTTGRGYYIIGVIAPSDEPTNHALRDISLCSSHLEGWGGKILLLFRSENEAGRFRLEDFPNLPSTVCFGIDNDRTILSEIKREMHLLSDTMPVFLIADTFNRVVFLSQGYTIGMGDQLINVIHRL